MHLSERLSTLPPYLVLEIANRANALRREGVDVINLSVGSPDFPPDSRIVEEAGRVLGMDGTHGYLVGRGHPEFRRAAAAYMGRRFGVEIDPETQVISLLGSKEGLAHLPIALCDPGDIGAYPDPGYLIYTPALHLAGAVPIPYPLDPARGWSPDWEQFEEILSGALKGGGALNGGGALKGGGAGQRHFRILILNYPHNPTAATADIDDFEQAVVWGRSRGAVVLNDNAYADIGFDGYRPGSILQAPASEGGAQGSGVVEFHSLSKTFSMAGWRCAFAVGDPELISALARVKSFYDTGSLEAIQRAAAVALDCADEIAQTVSDRYQARRDMILPALQAIGLTADTPRGTIYIWAGLPDGRKDDLAFCSELLEGAHVALSPGSAFGSGGEGYMRFSLTAPEERLEEAVERLKRFGG